MFGWVVTVISVIINGLFCMLKTLQCTVDVDRIREAKILEESITTNMLEQKCGDKNDYQLDFVSVTKGSHVDDLQIPLT